jgi:hypothetical protein
MKTVVCLLILISRHRSRWALSWGRRLPKARRREFESLRAHKACLLRKLQSGSTHVSVFHVQDGAEEGCKDALETLYGAVVMTAVLGQPEEVQHLGGALKVNDPASLLGFLADRQLRLEFD